MVRGRQAILLLAEIPIGARIDHPLGQILGAQQQVDSEALLAVKGAAAVVPPGKGLLVRMPMAIQIDETQLLQRLEAGALLLVFDPRPDPGGRAPAWWRRTWAAQLGTLLRPSPASPRQLSSGSGTMLKSPQSTFGPEGRPFHHPARSSNH